MWYKRFCSQAFERELKEIYKYVVNDLKSLIGWQSIKNNIWLAITNDGEPARYPKSYNYMANGNNPIKRMTVDKYTVFYQIDYDKKEIYLLHLLYRKN